MEILILSIIKLDSGLLQNIILGLFAVLIPFILSTLDSFKSSQFNQNGVIGKFRAAFFVHKIYKPYLTMGVGLLCLLLLAIGDIGSIKEVKQGDNNINYISLCIKVVGIFMLFYFTFRCFKIIGFFISEIINVENPNEKEIKKIQELDLKKNKELIIRTIVEIGELPNLSLKSQETYIKAYLKTIDSCILIEDWKSLGRIMSSFSNNIHNFSVLIIEEYLIQGIIDRLPKLMAEKNHETYLVTQFIEKTEKHLIIKGSMRVFFEKFELFFESRIIEDYTTWEKRLLPDIVKTFFENIESSNDRYTIWEYQYPKNWKIPYKLASEGSEIQKNILNFFIGWLSETIQNQKGYLNSVDNIITNLLPFCNPMLFGRLMEILLYNGISAKTTIEILKDAEYSLGVIGRMHTYSGDEENNNLEKIGIDEDKKTLKFIIDNFKNYKLINDNNYRKELIVSLEDKIDELSKNRRLHYSLYGIQLLDEFISENNI